MVLSDDQIFLKSTNNDDPELINLFQAEKGLLTMSETRLYPAGTPTEITFRIEKNNVLIGEIRLKNLRWFNRKAELSIIISEDYQRKGVGSAATKLLMEYAFNKMNLHRLEAEAIEYNKASISMLEKFGFVLEGTLREAKYSDGKYWGVYRYGLLRQEYLKHHKD